MDVSLILAYLRPGAEYGRLGDPASADEYDEMIVWRDEHSEKPSWAEVVTAWPAVRQTIPAPKSDAVRIAEEIAADPTAVTLLRAVLKV